MEPLRRWTAIAYRRHDEPHWHEFEPAPLTIAQARLMVRKGLLLMAQKRLSEMTTLMVMSPRQVIECSTTVTKTRHRLLVDKI